MFENAWIMRLCVCERDESTHMSAVMRWQAVVSRLLYTHILWLFPSTFFNCIDYYKRGFGHVHCCFLFFSFCLVVTCINILPNIRCACMNNWGWICMHALFTCRLDAMCGFAEIVQVNLWQKHIFSFLFLLFYVQLFYEFCTLHINFWCDNGRPRHIMFT